MSIAQLSEQLDEGRTTAVELAEEAHSAIVEGRDYNTFVSIREREDLLERAAEIDEQLEAGEPVGPLAGIPVAIKDNICTRDLGTTAGSAMLEDFESPYEATVVERLREAGAVIVGKTNLDEFAMGSSNETSHFGPVHNPRDPERSPGGSSGGSAAAVAADECVAALGSDTGGSVRQPASHCGVVGLKPTYGRVSRHGLVAYASSLDQIGPLTETVEDAAHMLEAIAGHDPEDATSADEPVPRYRRAVDEGIDELTLGVPEEFFGEAAGLDDEVAECVRSAIDELDEAGAEIVDVSLPHTEYAVAAYYLVATAEASSNLARYDGVRYGHRAEDADDLIEMYENSRAEGFGREVKRRIMLGTYVLSTGYYDQYYDKAQRVRTLIRRDFESVFEEVDALVGPTTPTPAFELGDTLDDPLQMYLQDVYTTSCNLAGLPGLSVPCGETPENLPVGL
jgi:aspartyl-tRNA(Asn)/glutamyl-tRNA(Gln) amidotransferase subunit A